MAWAPFMIAKGANSIASFSANCMEYPPQCFFCDDFRNCSYGASRIRIRAYWHEETRVITENECSISADRRRIVQHQRHPKCDTTALRI